MAGTLTKDLRFALLGEDVSASKSMTKVQEAAGEMSERVGKGLGALGNAVGGEFGNILNEAGDGVEGLKDHVKSLSTITTVGGGVMASAGVALQNFASGGEAATNQLKSAIETAGGSWDDYEKQIDDAVNKGADFGDNAVTVKNALTSLVSKTGDTKQSLKDLGVAEDLAAAQHISLGSAADQVARIMNGTGTRTLKQYGITMGTIVTPAKALATAQKGVETASKTLSSAQTKLQTVQASLQGKTKLTAAEQLKLKTAQEAVATASDGLKTAQQKLADAHNQSATNANIENQALAQLSAKISGQAPAATDTFSGRILSIRTHLSNWAEEMAGKVGPGLTVMGSTMTGVGATMELLKDTTLGVKIAETAQSAATGIATAAQWAFNAALDANPIGLVVLAVAALAAGIVWFFTQTKIGRELWQDMVNIVVGGWEALTGKISLQQWGQDFVNMWSDIKGAASEAWHGITAAATGWADGVIDDVNTLINGIDGAIGLINAIPGVSIPRIPDIPHLASGGIATKPTIALIGESGPEAVVPLNGGRLGGSGGGEGDIYVDVTVPNGFVGSNNQLAQMIVTMLVNAIRSGTVSRTELARALNGTT